MVAISLYRGNLHRVPDVPRQWPMPAPKISLKVLLHCRSRALSRLHPAADTVATTSNNPNPNPEEEGPAHGSPRLGPPKAEKIEERVGKEGGLEEEAKPELKGSDGGDCLVKPVGSGTLAGEKDVVPGSQSNQFCFGPLVNGMPKDVFASFGVCEWDTLMIEALSKTSNKEDALNDKDNRKREVEEKLQVLNARNIICYRGSPACKPQEALVAENDGRCVHCDSMQVPLASRATLGTTVSPSRFGPTSQHSQPANLPTVSVSGTNYVASSPSPAASGGTSVFRDSRLPSPWN
ncbi:hypothetical protein RJ639_036624 [Escallonia herrerae]|uniref:Uncharacterized protein n=1 Tax=Escallonia herrerae TaxID=1293975 RepID=A0AA88WS88_9ASTE|nr:hypothetical protein RJ639_036624 [Escallonia herrerae]